MEQDQKKAFELTDEEYDEILSSYGQNLSRCRS